MFLSTILTLAADTINPADALWAKAVMAGAALAGCAIALGWIGSSYMKAIGRNPEAGKAASQIVVIAAFVEAVALLTFLLAAFLISA